MKVKFWTCGNCGHEEPITDNDLQELNPVGFFRWRYKNQLPELWRLYD